LESLYTLLIWIGLVLWIGAIYAALAYYATIFPKQQFLLMFVLPVPAWLAVGGIFAVSSGG
jgi:rhomboid-like protein